MKKIISIILALAMLITGMLSLTSCGDDPELDFAALKTAFEKANANIYSVNGYDPANPKAGQVAPKVYEIQEGTISENPSVEKYLQISMGDPGDKGSFEFLYVYVFTDSAFASLMIEDIEISREATERECRVQIDICNHFLADEYKAKLSMEESTMYTTSLQKYTNELMFLEYTRYGKSGNIVWYGTEAAIAQSKI
jgi:hypothetical protein